ncbi:AraC family transcriptional regulator [Stenotrophomonas maltophilia]|nr:AraC family transcriptional regulator [Stenotrophomonas maltophilia]
MQRDTGMSYQAWRQQWRLMRAMELLLLGQRVAHVAQDTGFSAESPFIAFFRSMTGTHARRVPAPRKRERKGLSRFRLFDTGRGKNDLIPSVPFSTKNPGLRRGFSFQACR